MRPCNLRSLLLAAVVISNCITWTASRHHYTHNVSGHRSRHRRQGQGLFLSASYVLPGGEGDGWGEWGEVSPCSRTCGGGVASQKRICLQLGPDGQPQCTGGDTKYFSCQTQDCPAGSKDFRSEQCSEFDGQEFGRFNIKYKWVPYTKTTNPCELNCMPHGERFYYRHKLQVVDGTRCNDESFDVCVNGICQPVGCDMMLGSNAREDKCRECRGNGANCQTTHGILDTQDIRKGYNDMLLIPEGATSIVISEIAPSSNYLALRAQNYTYYLNGNYHIDFPRSLMIAGALWYYERSEHGLPAPDKLRCLGPTNEPLYLSLLLQDVNVGIEYEYSLPNEAVPPKNKRYNWVHDEFTPCSAPCGGGTQTRNVTCREREQLEQVEAVLCDEGLRPDSARACNTQPCAAQWSPGDWGACSKRCGDGGTRSRDVHCTQVISNGYPSIVADKSCFDTLGPKPELYQKCNENATCPTWFVGHWKPCDKLCDEGKQKRQVICYQKNGRRIEVLNDEDCEDEKPDDEQTCMLQPCVGVDWVLSKWTGCDSCLSTVRSRTAICVTKNKELVNDTFCSYHPTPVLQESCDKSKLPPCDVQWYATQWSKCSVECGKGVQTRKVFCGIFDGASVNRVEDSRCAGQPKYNDTKECEIPQDKCPSQWFAGPWTACSEKCGGGEKYRRIMCLRGGKPASDCPENTIPDDQETCNTFPCNKDELLPLDKKTTPLIDDDYEDCDDADYSEVGLDEDSGPSKYTEMDMMLSDAPTFEGSGLGSTWTTAIAEHESTFETEEGSGVWLSTSNGPSSTSLDTEMEGSGMWILSTTSESSSTDSSTTEGTELTESTDTSATDATDGTSDFTVSSISTEQTSESSSLTDDDISTITETTDTESTETGNTETETSTTSSGTSETGTSESGITDITAETTESGITETETSESDITVTGSTETSIIPVSETGTSESSTTESSNTETGTTETETSESATTETGTSESGTTETGTTESGTTETGTSESSTTEVSTSESDGSTTETGTTELGTTESGTTEGGTSETSESTTESGVTETGTSQGTDTSTVESSSTEISSTEFSTTESGTTETGVSETGVSETGTTESDVTETGITETGTTETGTTETGTTETGTTETGTTESGTTETGTTETGTTETGTTETGTTETGSTEATEVSGTGSSEAAETTTELTSSSMGITRWDLSSTVEVYTTKRARVCRPRPSCVDSEFGCCPDKKSAALGPFDAGCLKPKTCNSSLYGCCPDGLSPAKGPRNLGCPTEPCEDTLFGCCESDKKTPAEGNDQEGCPPPPPACQSSKYGCCKDGETEATGPEKEGCPETVTETEEPPTKVPEESEPTSTISSESSTMGMDCSETEFGCCLDNTTAASGPELQGCSCANTQFGCCPDGVSAAQGPELEGCVKSCNTSTYGCCPDGNTPAHGPDGEGCCLLYAFGCCLDNYTPARGPHLEGCGCEESRYGCCPDNVTIATGPDHLGCGCQYTTHGCCPNRHDEASGPNFEGCPCHTYQFGCCPDGVTIARGHNGQGCYCQQSDYGCCGDEQTHAKGPNMEGCDCSSSKYGCCPDGTTEATGPKFQGCTDKPENRQASCSLEFERGSCHNYTVNWYFDTAYGGCSRFWYGGCEGNGNRFPSKEECEDTCVSPPPKDACKLPQNKGGCLGYNVRWYFDTEREMCTNFIYGGCLGNNNNFETREACQQQCEPERAVDQCELEIDRGSCAGNFPRWGFNKNTRSCEEFIWGGCEGNSNRFRTEAACLHRCNPPGEPQPQCLEPLEAGNCSDKDALWAFSQSENRCVPFYYTGCGGNENKFHSLEDCQQTCPSAFVPELCAKPADPGNCYNYREQWYYDTKEQRCQQFYYGGCRGNENRFETQQACESTCAAPLTTTPAPTAASTPPRQPEQEQAVCFMAIDTGPCDRYIESWAYDYTIGKCVSFQYGGCAGNQNNFRSEEDCQRYCVQTQDICQLPMLSGPCNDSIMSWFYDASTDSCSQFAYGGCEGNENRFESREQCEERCKTGPASTTTAIVPTVPAECIVPIDLEPCNAQSAGQAWYYDVATSSCKSHDNGVEGNQCRTTGTFYSEEDCLRSCGAFRNIDVCRYNVDPGPCNHIIPKYYFNASSGRCEEFVFGGCVGGPNRFSTEQECHQVCLANVDPCSQPPEPGNCLGHQILWYYDQSRDQCNQFAYRGCGGNENKFDTRELCESRCKKQGLVTTTTPVPVQTPRQPSPECVSPDSLEPCGNNVTAFYFDDVSQMCRAAPIGDCRYSNSYVSEEDCLRHCGAFRGLDVCNAPLDPGPCRAYFPKFYFDTATGSCKPYAYGGCGGGPNRFSSAEECDQICGSEGPAAACLQEVSSGARCDVTPQRRWHYNAERAECLVFAYLGCGGNDNNFQSYEECASLCRVQPTVSEREPYSSQLCDQYSEECQSLETSCVYGVNVSVAVEGCQRCSCYDAPGGEPVRCDQRALECGALRCSYGIQRTTDQDGCEKCECADDPCKRNSCSELETCVPVPTVDPVTQVTVYIARCEPRPETNEVLPECEANALECARISCPRGVRRSGVRGCERCECVETCSGAVCTESERCVSYSLYDPITRETQNRSRCVSVNKPGMCPPEPSPERECRATCDDDADCRGVGKCCASGPCARHCRYPLAPTTPAPPSTTHGPEPQRAPEPSIETKPEVSATEGGMATLRCIFHGNPPPQITWRFGEITIDGDKDRYRLLSDGALEIVSLYRNDSGVYICIADNGLGTSQQEVRLEVSDPVPTAAQIAGPRKATVVGVLGRPLALRCPVYGYPSPGVYWYRGENGPMVEFSSNTYEARDNVLLIRRLTPDTLGDYLCTAYNGYDRPANWLVTVEPYRPVVQVTPRVQTTTTSTTPRPVLTTAAYSEGPRAPEPNTETKPEVAASVGGKATLRCIFHGNPPPRIIWTFGEVTIDGDKDRYRLLSDGALEIVSVYRNDSGVYICVADNGLGTARQEVRLQVTDPVPTAAQIAGPSSGVVFGVLGRPLALRCPVYGYPAPGVNWYRGENEPMVEFSSDQYEARGNVLLIRRLTTDTLGDYLCRAYNGVGGVRPVKWIVSVYESERPEESVTNRRPTDTTPVNMYPPPNYEQVWTRLLPASTNISTGSELSLPCEVGGYPEPAVRWAKDGVDLASNDRIWITESRLTIQHTQRSDSGLYSCHAANLFSSHQSSVQINVQDVYIPAKCKDNPTFANCNLIVQSRFCKHKYYSSFCCKSCVEAGQLDPRDVEMQADEPYRKK